MNPIRTKSGMMAAFMEWAAGGGKEPAPVYTQSKGDHCQRSKQGGNHVGGAFGHNKGGSRRLRRLFFSVLRSDFKRRLLQLSRLKAA